MSIGRDATYTLVLFDFDGTLYDAESQFDVYIEEVARHLPEDQRQGLRDDFAQVKAREGAIRIGQWYNREAKRTQPESAAGVHPSGTYIGDYWWIVHFLGHARGIPDALLQESFLRTRAYMMEHPHEAQLVTGLKPWLEEIRASRADGNTRNATPILALATNSPAEDSLSILQDLGVRELFDDITCMSNKPVGMPGILARLSEKYNVAPANILSIGDHYFNDVAPALAFGADGLWINRHHVNHVHHATYEVTTNEAFLQTLRGLHFA